MIRRGTVGEVSTTTGSDPQLHVSRHDLLGRYEGRLDDELVAVVEYRREGSTVVITHTGTEPAYRGRGLAGQLTAAVLEEIRAAGQHVRPLCPYTAGYLETHPEYADLVG